MEAKEHWIFYLKLTMDLSEEFILLDNEFKKTNKSLIPVTFKTLLDCVHQNRSIHVMVVVKSYREYRYFHKKIKKLLKYLMRTERIHLYIASSFSSINDPSIMKKNRYQFERLPISYKELCGKISQWIDVREDKQDVWPGGVRPRMSLAG